MDSQVASGRRATVFVSATSADLRECRRATADFLLESGIFPVDQDHFGPDHRTIERLLAEKIRASDAVICLVGHAFGTPSDKVGAPERSYTQMEFDLACRFGKPLYVFVATDEYGRSHPVSEPDDIRFLQEAFRREVLGRREKYELFSSRDELVRRLHGILRPILERVSKRALVYIHSHPPPPLFVGRTEELAQLNAALEDPSPSTVVVLGMGGQGKSTLVDHALRAREGLPFAAGIWVSAYRGGFTFSHFLDAALEALLGDEFDKSTTATVEARISRLMRAMQERPLLVVIDGIERWLRGWGGGAPTSGSAGPARQGAFEGLDSFLADAASLQNGSHVVLTTRAVPRVLDTLRCRLVPVRPRGAPDVGLRGWSPEAAIEYLQSREVPAPPEGYLEIARRLFFHPLALTAYATLARNLGPLWSGSEPAAVLSEDEAVRQMFDETREHLPDRERSLLLLELAALPLDDVPLGLLAWLASWTEGLAAESEQTLARRVVELAGWSVLSWDPKALTVSMHDLYKRYFAARWDEDGAGRTHARIATWYASRDFSSPRGSLADARLPFLAVKHALLAGDPRRALALLFERGAGGASLHDWLVANGHLWECAELVAEAARVATGPARARCLLARARLLHELDLPQRASADVEEAEMLFCEADPAGASAYPTEVARCRAFRGIISSETGKASEAVRFLSEALELLGSGSKPESAPLLDIARTLANRAMARWGVGEWDAAFEDTGRAREVLAASPVAGREEAEGLALEILGNEGVFFLARGDPQQAVAALEQAVHALRERPAPKGLLDRNRQLLLVSLGAAYNAVGRPEAAAAVLAEAIEPLDRLEGEGRFNPRCLLALALTNLARAHALHDEPNRALEAATRAVRLYGVQIELGADQFKGQLASALFVRALAAHRVGQVEECARDLDAAMSLCSDYLREWFEESDIANAFIDRATEALGALGGGYAPQRRRLLTMVVWVRARLLKATPELASARRALSVLDRSWCELREIAPALGVALPEAAGETEQVP